MQKDGALCVAIDCECKWCPICVHTTVTSDQIWRQIHCWWRAIFSRFCSGAWFDRLASAAPNTRLMEMGRKSNVKKSTSHPSLTKGPRCAEPKHKIRDPRSGIFNNVAHHGPCTQLTDALRPALPMRGFAVDLGYGSASFTVPFCFTQGKMTLHFRDNQGSASGAKDPSAVPLRRTWCSLIGSSTRTQSRP